MANGRVRRGWLGLAGQHRPLGRDLVRRLELWRLRVPGSAAARSNPEGYSGVEITGFDERGPAARSGLRIGDVVVGMGDGPVESADDLHRALQKWPIVDALKLRVVRDGALVDVEVTPIEGPS